MSATKKAEDLKNRGNDLFRSGRYQQAAEQYTEAVKLDPKNALVYSNRSLTHMKLNDYPSALADARRCVEVRPQWAKGYLRKAAALEGLGRYEEVMATAVDGFKLSSDGILSREIIECWFRANQKIHQLPEGAIELPRGIYILSSEYLTVLACLMQSLSGEQPLTQSLMEQCLYSCATQMEKVLGDFGESVSDVIKEWAKHLPQEIFPYSTNPSQKDEVAKQMNIRTDAFVKYLEKEVDPALHTILRPILGLVVLVVLNRSNIFCESNTGHHSAELMNRALLPLFERSVLRTEEYYSMYVGRICAVLDSFIGRGYRLSADEISTVRVYCKKLEKAMEGYPRHLPEHTKDQAVAREALNNIKFNVLLLAQSTPPTIPTEGPMSVQLAEQVVKQRPDEVQSFLRKHLAAIESTPFPSMRDVEDLITMTGIYLDLDDQDSALSVFKRGEQTFFSVLGHLLSTHALKLDQCPATITPIRQLVFSRASLLQKPSLFADVTVRWKCLFTEFRSQLIRQGLGSLFGDLFAWYVKERSTQKPAPADSIQEVLLQHMQKEEKLLQASARPTLNVLSQQNYHAILDNLKVGEVVLDYVFFATTQENPLLEAYCVALEKEKIPTVCSLDYGAVRRLAAVLRGLLSLAGFKEREGQDNQLVDARIKMELSHLAQVLLPRLLSNILASGRVTHVFISPDADIAMLPLDMLPFGDDNLPLFKQFSVSIVSCSRELVRPQATELLCGSQSTSDGTGDCYIVSNPNYNLKKPVEQTPLLSSLVEALSSYLNISQESTACVEGLEHSKEEAKSISSSLESAGLTVRVIHEDNAILSQVLSIANPLLLHVSSHAFAVAERSTFRGNFWSDLKSSIALAGYNTYAQQHFSQLHPDAGIGQLPALAVCSMNLKGTRLVFLSTCISAVGSSLAQEAVSSLVEAFLAAGANTVIATLWPIADSPAAEFCKHFYDKIKERKVRPSEALSHAKQQLQSGAAQSHWFYWGAFACYGLDKPLIT